MSRYDDPPEQFGIVFAGIYFKTHEQAEFLQSIIQDAMIKHAGMQQEALLARWNNEIQYQRNKATKENWRGWEGQQHDKG